MPVKLFLTEKKCGDISYPVPLRLTRLPRPHRSTPMLIRLSESYAFFALRCPYRFLYLVIQVVPLLLLWALSWVAARLAVDKAPPHLPCHARLSLPRFSLRGRGVSLHRHYCPCRPHRISWLPWLTLPHLRYNSRLYRRIDTVVPTKWRFVSAPVMIGLPAF
jgi:hypothetical protein